MIRIAISGDHHCNEKSRFDEWSRIHLWMVDDMRERGVDLFLSGGDIYEHASTPFEREANALWLQEISFYATVIGVRGNHDAARDINIMSSIATMNDASEIVMVDFPTIIRQKGVSVACLPWPRKADLHAYLRTISVKQPEAVGKELLRNIIRGLGEELRYSDGSKILLAHAMVTGSKTSTGQTLVGCDFELGLDDLALANADFIALGHIHKAQEWGYNGVPIIYTGSPMRHNFGEMEEKSYTIVEFEDNKLVNWYRVPTPATPMQHVNGKWVVGECVDSENNPALDVEQTDIEPGAEVRFRYTVDSDQREAAKIAANEWRDKAIAQGAISVKIEDVVNPTTRARAPEIATATTLQEKLSAYWKAKNIEPGSERKQRLFEKLNTLEESCGSNL